MALRSATPPPTYSLTNVQAATPLASKTLWTYKGPIWIYGVHGLITSAIQAQATTCKISVQNDALAAIDLCATLDLTGKAAGTILQLPAAVGSAMVATTLGGALNLLTTPYMTASITSGLITVTYGAASSGIINWSLIYAPLDPATTIF